MSNMPLNDKDPSNKKSVIGGSFYYLHKHGLA